MFRVATGLHACAIGEVPVILDEYRGRYFLLRGETGRRFLSFLRGSADAKDCHALLDAHLITRTENPGPDMPEILQPRCSYTHVPHLGEALALLPRAFFMQFSAIRRVRHLHLADILKSLKMAPEHDSTPSHRGNRVTEADISRAFCTIQMLTPSRDLCVPRSLAIAQMLRSFGHRPTVIIGVQLPIAAHCWVQCEDRLIGDSLERISAFQPIFAA